MRILYMGTPEFAIKPLQSLYDAGHEIVALVTNPDRQRDRGKKLQHAPIKEWAKSRGIEVLQPERVKGNVEFIESVRGMSPDLAVVAAYGQILPKEFLEIPRYGCINIHASLLPRHRGAAPIQKAILDGDMQTGISIMHVEEELDAGAVYDVATTPVLKKNAADLHDELSLIGADLVLKTIADIENGKAHPVRQDAAKATYAPMISKSDGRLSFSKPADVLERMVRAFSPSPGTFFYMSGKRFKVWSAEVDPTRSGEAGRIAFANDDGLGIFCDEGVFIIKEIQAEGRKRMSAGEFLRGGKIDISEKLE